MDEYKTQDSFKLKAVGENSLRKLFTGAAFAILLGLLYRDLFIKETTYFLDVITSLIGIALFNRYYEKMHQDNVSYFFFLFTLVLHDLGLYATSPLGIRFDHYMHFIGGFTIALVADRAFNEKMGRFKRFALLLALGIGIGAIGEVAEWIGYTYLGYGEGFFLYGAGDEGEWRNAMIDLIFDGLGAMMLFMLTLKIKMFQSSNKYKYGLRNN